MRRSFPHRLSTHLITHDNMHDTTIIGRLDVVLVRREIPLAGSTKLTGRRLNRQPALARQAPTAARRRCGLCVRGRLRLALKVRALVWGLDLEL